MNPSIVVAFARETLGCAYGHQGRCNGVSLDCAGPAVHVARQIGMSLAPAARYGRQPVPAEIRAGLNQYMVKVPRARMQIGDLVWLHVKGHPQHLGILADYHLGGFSLIHAANHAGLRSVVEHRLDSSWESRILSVWRFPGVDAA